ncbi:MarR family winged helix-turn-helix transcriptional regulator [Streptomyces gilvus]|uniref:MarR family winged helix-turn-helix transcriptional regulator n=1 Tax=Streptomyces gilvus TaxID=2920937 RepID=UPI001F0EFDFB|nr:MarR family transcriptional regulator [Streptomyces sp. CME 23]MCH5674336.1 MarR family transcriptional regulator [Streptomyces sp. CME 23]
MDHLPEAARIRRGVIRLNRRLRQERGDGCLSPNQLSVLGHLHRHGPSTPGEVAAAERQRPQSLTRVFAELETEGLILRAPDPNDRRQSVLSLTEAGRLAVEDDMAERDMWLARALGTLGETERGVLALAAEVMERLANAEVEAPGEEDLNPRP